MSEVNRMVNVKRLAKRVVPLVVIAGVLVAGLRGAELHFLKSGAVDAGALLPAPPVAGSAEAEAEVQMVLKLQAGRTEAEVARANAEAKLTPASFAGVMGEWFTAENVPQVFAILSDAAADSKVMSDSAKAIYKRQRPQFIDSAVHPSIAGETDASYPSGHGVRGILWATILSEMVPEKKEALFTRGQEIGWDRVIAGVHFPSDIYAGRMLGMAVARELLKNPEFQGRLAKAKAELEGVMRARAAK